jgi:hypothetical protein
VFLVEGWQDMRARESKLERQAKLLEERNGSLERELRDAHIKAPSPPESPTVFEGFEDPLN